jgi:hypothetical protein
MEVMCDMVVSLQQHGGRFEFAASTLRFSAYTGELPKCVCHLHITIPVLEISKMLVIDDTLGNAASS